VIAETEDQFNDLLNNEEFLLDWQMKELVDAATTALGPLPLGQKFCLKIPGVLGGQYSLENIATAPLKELIGFSGSLAYQAKDLPDGSQVELVVVNGPSEG
jgi:hypothetical protein